MMNDLLGDEAKHECAQSALRRLARAAKAPGRLNAELPLAQLPEFADFSKMAIHEAAKQIEILDSGAERTCLRDSKELAQELSPLAIALGNQT